MHIIAQTFIVNKNIVTDTVFKLYLLVIIYIN